MESYSEEKQLARVKAGLTGGPFFSNMNKQPSMKFVEGWPAGTAERLKHQPISQGTPVDAWNQRGRK